LYQFPVLEILGKVLLLLLSGCKHAHSCYCHL